MAIWRRRGDYKTVSEMIAGVSGMTHEELTAPVKVPANEIENMPAAALLLKQCIFEGRQIVIVGDYDVDGITATAILVFLLRWYGVNPRTIIPRRITDGYGISDTLLQGIEHSLIITVDNGIAAAQQLQCVMERDNRVIVLDHHLSNELPPVDVVVDPHVTQGKSAYSDYCGAGLALKLAEQMLPFPSEYPDLFYNLTVLACLGTIADVMPLTGDNRRIVREGLQIMRSRVGFSLLKPGLREILKLGGSPLDEETVKFTIGPVINAVGRMYDAGSTSTLKALLCEEDVQAASFASKMKSINEERKAAVNRSYESYAAQVNPEKTVQVLYVPDVPEGIVGIIAGKLAEALRMPVFVFTDSQTEAVYKGSARSYADFDLFSVVEEIRDLTTAAGGHAGAAGLSVRRENFDALKSAIERAVEEREFQPGEDVLYYDLELRASELTAAYEQQKSFAPFGEGCPLPVVLLRAFRPVARQGETYRFMGGNSQHVRLYGPDFEIVAFNRGEELRKLGLPDALDIVGTMCVNVFNGKTTVQLKPLDFRPAEN